MNSSGSSHKIQKSIAGLAKLVWYLVAFTMLGYYLWLMYQYHDVISPPTERIAAVMNRLGLAGDVYAFVTLLADALFVGTFMFMGFLMFWRRGDNPVVYAASLTMITLTSIFTGLIWYRSNVPYEAYIFGLERVISFLANSLGLLAIYTLPDGKFVPRWTRWLFLLSIVYLIAFFATSHYWSLEFEIISRLIVFLLPILTLQFYRYRHVSNSIQRQQTKWMILGIIVAILAFFALGIPAQLIPVGSDDAIIYRLISLPIRSIFLMALPLGFGFAALRYRLWDIDLTLNRSLVLAFVTLLLAVLFAIVFFIAHPLLTMMLPANHEVIAAAIAAALSVAAFSPTRRFVRHFVDRRFYGFRFDLNELRAAQERNQASARQGSYTGKQVEGFTLGNLIGRGGMGEVYEGLNGAQAVAIKTLPASYFQDETARRRFEREAQATKRLNHPNVVRVLSSGFSSDLAYIILEYITGDDLKSLILKRGALPLDDTLDILRGITAALDAVHQEGIVHRDLKPANVMLPMSADGETYHPVLMDFGLARIDNLGTSLTGSGAIGTVAYMSPEQFLESRSVDYHADIYSLGVMAYEMLSGKPPFEGNAGQIMFAHIQQPPPDLAELKAEIPADISKAIQKAMAKDAKERFNSASEFIAALSQAAEPSGVPEISL
jgi:tRNA A-37 threonylcarbamoyl transferase component Bud32